MQFGCAAWLEQHERLEQLNLQAHHNMHFHSDEFVMAALVASGKLPVLVHELLVSEVRPSVDTCRMYVRAPNACDAHCVRYHPCN